MASSSGSCKRALDSQECQGVGSKRSCKESPSTSSDEGVTVRLIKDDAEKVIIYLAGSDSDEEQITIAADLADHYSCSSINANESRHLFMKNFGIKRFLVDHDYILFPYCLTSDEGRREKPSLTRVSMIIERQRENKRYEELVEILQIFDTILKKDTSTKQGMRALAGDVFDKEKSFSSKEKLCMEFRIVIRELLSEFEEGTDQESIYRSVFASFLRIVSSRTSSAIIMEEPKLMENTVSFPNWNKNTNVSGKPDIIIRKYDGTKCSTLAVIECRKYREMTVMFENTVIKDDNDLQKAIPKVRFSKVVKTSGNSYEVPKKEDTLERIYKDLDASICRPLKRDENNYFGGFLAQLVGEVLAWFNTCKDIPVLLPLKMAQEKSVRYAIGQLGFKIIFITVGMNNSYIKSPPHIRIGESKGMGLDVFMTRPLDLMIADDRAKIRDILVAMMVMPRRTND